MLTEKFVNVVSQFKHGFTLNLSWVSCQYRHDINIFKNVTRIVAFSDNIKGFRQLT